MKKRTIAAIGEDREKIESIPEEDYERASREQKNIRYGQDTKERKLLSHWVMWVVSAWLFLVLMAIVLNKLLRFDIEPAVSVVLLGTTTINILGLAYIVLQGLFGKTRR